MKRSMEIAIISIGLVFGFFVQAKDFSIGSYNKPKQVTITVTHLLGICVDKQFVEAYSSETNLAKTPLYPDDIDSGKILFLHPGEKIKLFFNIATYDPTGTVQITYKGKTYYCGGMAMTDNTDINSFKRRV